MGLFEYEQEPHSETVSDEGRNTDDVSEPGKVKEFKPVSVVDSGSNGYSQLRVTIPSKFVKQLGISSDDHVLMGVRDGELVVIRP